MGTGTLRAEGRWLEILEMAEGTLDLEESVSAGCPGTGLAKVPVHPGL